MNASIQAQIDEAWASHLLTAGPRKVATRTRQAEAQNWRCPKCGTRLDGSGPQDNAPALNRAFKVVLCVGCTAKHQRYMRNAALAVATRDRRVLTCSDSR